jgi:hypothetical protein
MMHYEDGAVMRPGIKVIELSGKAVESQRALLSMPTQTKRPTASTQPKYQANQPLNKNIY